MTPRCRECGQVVEEFDDGWHHMYDHDTIDEDADDAHRAEPDETCDQCGKLGMFCVCDRRD